MYYRNTRNTGFTVVELLVVIVIIGILAAITTVAFNGIQNRAKNARIGSAIDSYAKALAYYKSTNGTYPSTVRVEGGSTILDTVCLGDKYPARDGFSAGTCYLYASSSSPSNRVSVSLNDAIGKVLSSQPDVSDVLLPDGSSRGLFYSSLTADSTQANIFYRISGDQVCARGTKVTGNDGGPYTACILFLN
ncbi:MAG: prepilin-type N-terminal cleavage/methylation domain-containing protein [Sphingobacteriales bacterium]|nr:MAG: prepilin-type N-terminal cleavage/methylation domain-containing protein [Sphingobacteriales bacterium]